jgi:hypothetical protein
MNDPAKEKRTPDAHSDIVRRETVRGRAAAAGLAVPAKLERRCGVGRRGDPGKVL